MMLCITSLLPGAKPVHQYFLSKNPEYDSAFADDCV